MTCSNDHKTFHLVDILQLSRAQNQSSNSHAYLVYLFENIFARIDIETISHISWIYSRHFQEAVQIKQLLMYKKTTSRNKIKE